MMVLLQSGLKNQDLTDKKEIKMGRKRKRKTKKRLPPRVKSGKNKGRFRKRK